MFFSLTWSFTEYNITVLIFGQAMLLQGMYFVAVEWSFIVKLAEFLTQISAGKEHSLFCSSVHCCIYFTDYIHRFCWRDGCCSSAGTVHWKTMFFSTSIAFYIAPGFLRCRIFGVWELKYGYHKHLQSKL